MLVKYERVINRLTPSTREQQIINAVKQGILGDKQKSPFDNNKWYMKFARVNQDGVSLKDAPKNTLLMVVTESLSTLYRQNRGTRIERGSILVKLEEDLVACIDAYTWVITSNNGTHTLSMNGFFGIDPKSLNGKVKLISDVKL